MVSQFFCSVLTNRGPRRDSFPGVFYCPFPEVLMNKFAGCPGPGLCPGEGRVPGRGQTTARWQLGTRAIRETNRTLKLDAMEYLRMTPESCPLMKGMC